MDNSLSPSKSEANFDVAATLGIDAADRPTPLEMLAYLVGGWSVERASDAGYRFVGTLRVRRVSKKGLVGVERGESIVGSRRLAASREYAFRVGDSGEQIEVLVSGVGAGSGLAGMGLLHRLVFREEGGLVRAAHEHVCGGDIYRIEMVIVGADRFETTYCVRGPNKGYRLRSGYRRI